jgi:hypothetical protein
VAAVALAGAAADPPKTKQELKKEQRLKLLEAKKAEEAKKAAEAPKPVASVKPAAPAKPLDPAALARLIDEQIDRRLAEAKVNPAPLASDAEFLRRVYLDLTGVIPTPEKARAFLDSTDPDKRARLIDELLASPNYGRRQADLWVPKLFPKDSANRFVLKEPFVRWLEAEFNANTPWNEFVTKLVTATGTVEQNPAVTYFLANRSVDKLTDTCTQHFLGIQLQCAQCHNHPFTGWKQTEYWGMAAFFSKVNPQNPKNANKGGDNTQIGVRETAAKTKLKDFFPEATKVVPPKVLGGDEVKASAADPLRPVLAAWMTAPDNPYFARAMVNRTWAMLFGRGFVNPIDDMHEDNQPSHPELLTELSAAFARGHDVKALVRGICLSRAYQRTSKPTAGDDALFARMTMKVMTPEQLYDSLTQVAGATQMAQAREKAAAQNKQGGNGPRDQFVQFFLAGAEEPSLTDYEAGIPQALRMMNGRLSANPAVVRAFVKPGAKPAEVIESIYLAALSRRPTDGEVAKLTAYVSKAATPAEGYGDVLWAVLNSSEFAMVR